MIEWILFKDRLCLDGLEHAASEGKVSEILGCGAECVCIRLSGRVWVCVCVCAVNTIAHLASLTDMQYKHYKYATIWKSAFHTFCTDCGSDQDPPLACPCAYTPGVCSQMIWMNFLLDTVIYHMQNGPGHSDICYQQWQW